MPIGVYIRTKPSWNKGKHKMRVCLQCGMEFYKPNNRGRGKFCNQHCFGLYNIEKQGGCVPNSEKTRINKGHPLYGKHSFVKGDKRISGDNNPAKRPEVREKLSIGQRGEKGSNWQGGITPVSKLIRSCGKYIEWRSKVFERDNYTCQECGAKSGMGKTVKLNVSTNIKL